MNYRIYKLIIMAGIFLIGLSSNVTSQTEADETAKVKKRAEALLQTIRDEKWNEISKFVVVKEIDNQAGKSAKIFRFATDNETKEKIINRFKQTYSALKPGRIISVNIFEKDKTIAGIAYKHGDKDGFKMFLIDGEWYYAVEYLQ